MYSNKFEPINYIMSPIHRTILISNCWQDGGGKISNDIIAIYLKTVDFGSLARRHT